MPYQILFVDDDPLLLSGLGRMLRPMRQQWDMTFTAGPDAALASIRTTPFDVIVSDMRMPEMDGAELLTEARRLQPGAMRVILSGQANDGAAIRCLEVAHQSLGKPCDAAMLTGCISSALQRRDLVGASAVATAVTAMAVLPCRPESRRRLHAELEDPSPSTSRIADVVGSDLGMACKLLQVANSALFSGDRRQTVNVGNALLGVGIDPIRQLAASPTGFGDFVDEALLEWVHEVTLHGVEARDLCEMVAVRAGLPRPTVEAAATAGLLHDVGKLALAVIEPTRYADLLRRADCPSGALWRIEREELGTSHVEVGAYLLALWGVPAAIVDAVARHYGEAGGSDADDSPAAILQSALAELWAERLSLASGD